MTYKSLFDEAKKAKKLVKLAAEYIQFEDKGQQIIGKLLNINHVKSSAGEGYYNQYLFDTDKGKVKFALGTATDTDSGALMKIGGVYSVTYKGQETLSGGRKMNQFDIQLVVEPTEEPVGGGSDIPF